MAASKKSKSSAKNRAPKRTAGKRQPARGSAKNATKRTRRAATKGDAVKSPRTRSAPPSKAAVTPLASARLGGREPERKPLKKAEPRANRPPAVLPIPQSTFFF